MMDDWEILALLAGAIVFMSHRILASGFHQEIPLSSESASIGAGLAVLAMGGVALNSYVYDGT